MGATNETSVLIGDTDNDAKGAVKAHTPFIAVTYGFGFKTAEDVRVYPHIGVANTPMDVANIILKGHV